MVIDQSRLGGSVVRLNLKIFFGEWVELEQAKNFRNINININRKRAMKPTQFELFFEKFIKSRHPLMVWDLSFD